MAKKEKELEIDIPRIDEESTLASISSLLDLIKARETQDKQNQLLERIAIAIEKLADK